jgi:CheY-like chemotaxis protein
MTKPVVLIVECEALIRISAVHIVEDAGFSVLEACNADDAIRLLESRSEIRAVLTGVNMPGSMDGLKLAHAIRGRWPPVHLIVTSGLNVRDRLPSSSRFIHKPYSAEHIRIALSELFGSHPAPRQLFRGGGGNCANVA